MSLINVKTWRKVSAFCDKHWRHGSVFHFPVHSTDSMPALQ